MKEPSKFTFLLTQEPDKNGTLGEGSTNQDCWKVVSPWPYTTPYPRIAEEEKYGMDPFFIILEWF